MKPHSSAELDQRNQLRAEAQLPAVAYHQEVRRLKAIFERARSEEFYSASYDMISEVYGQPQKTDFDSLSDMMWFFTSKRNVIRRMLRDTDIRVPE